MGYAYYELAGPDDIPRKRGYGVRCKCHHRGCPERIDRGLGYLCYHCTWYFCGKHLSYTYGGAECFAGRSGQVCTRCARELGETSFVNTCPNAQHPASPPGVDIDPPPVLHSR